MSASLVGSEMCIRDRFCPHRRRGQIIEYPNICLSIRRPPSGLPWGPPPVSYTHLTLPTICSV
eukprot:7506913-Alexandrium_andersonii.AAC.1